MDSLKIRTCWIVVPFLLLSALLLAQNNQGTAYNFSKVSDFKNLNTGSSGGPMDVDLFTGRIQGSIPLLSGLDPYSSISLSYSYTGCRPETDDGIVGLGWELQAGGMITRAVKGIPDESVNQWNNELLNGEICRTASDLTYDRLFNFNPEKPQEKPDGTDWEKDWRFLDYLAIKKYDSEFDVFTINAPGIGGSFVFLHKSAQVNDYEIRWLSAKSCDIKLYFSNNRIVKIEATTLSGVKYTFDNVIVQTTSTSTTTLMHLVYKPNNEAIGSPEHSSETVDMGWQLRKIELPDGKQITYEFKSTTSIYSYATSSYLSNVRKARVLSKYNGIPAHSPGFENCSIAIGTPLPAVPNVEPLNPPTVAQNFFPDMMQSTTMVVCTTFKYVPEKIVSENYSVVLYYGNRGSKLYLTNLVLTNSRNGKSYGSVLTYNVLRKEGYVDMDLNSGTLFLKAVENFAEGGISPGPLFFEYLSGPYVPIPINNPLGHARGNYLAVDHWGFYNGALENHYTTWPTNFDPNNNESNYDFKKVGAISRIIMPGGSESQIGYDYNQIAHPVTGAPFQVGGIRVKTITSKLPGQPDRVIEYKYGDGNSLPGSLTTANLNGLGYSLFENQHSPKYSEESRYSWAIFEPNQYPNQPHNTVKIKAQFTSISLTPLNSMSDELGRSVVYPQVTQILPEGSKIQHQFALPYIWGGPGKGKTKVWGYSYRFNAGEGNCTGWLPDNPNNIPADLIGSHGFCTSDYYDQLNLGKFHRIPHFFADASKPAEDHRILRTYSSFIPGGETLEKRIFRVDGKLISRATTTFTTITRAGYLPTLRIQSFWNYQINVLGTEAQKNAIRTELIGEMLVDATAIPPRLKKDVEASRFQWNEGSTYLYNFTSDFTERVPVVTTTFNYDYMDGSEVVESSQKTTLFYHSNPELFKRVNATETVQETRSCTTLPCTTNPFQSSYVRMEYHHLQDVVPAAQLTVWKDKSQFNISQMLNTSNADRTILAMALPYQNGYDLEPLETIVYKDILPLSIISASNCTTLNSKSVAIYGVSFNLPWFWGNSVSYPKIGTKYVYSFDRGFPLCPNAYGNLSYSTSNVFVPDGSYKIKSEVTEVNEYGFPLTTLPAIGPPSGVLYGYQKTTPIAEIAFAKGSECGYSSFEVPIKEQKDENGWTVYDLPDGGTEPRCLVEANDAYSGGKCVRINNSYGPTFSLPIPENHPKDYIFEVWVKKADPSLQSPPFTIGGYLHRGDQFNSVSYCYGHKDDHAGNEWQKYRVTIPVKDAEVTVPPGAQLKLRVFVQSRKELASDHPEWSDLLVDECRLYPIDALMKTTVVDVHTGNKTIVDAKGKRVESKNTPTYSTTFDGLGNLRTVQFLNVTK